MTRSFLLSDALDISEELLFQERSRVQEAGKTLNLGQDPYLFLTMVVENLESEPEG